MPMSHLLSYLIKAAMASVFGGLYSMSSAVLAFLSGRNKSDKPASAHTGSNLGLNSRGRRNTSAAVTTFSDIG